MIEYIQGTIIKLQPTFLILEQSGIGYYIHISLHTCEHLSEKKPAKLLIHEVIREDAHDLFGFYNEEERTLFRLLISISGIGANTARVILSKLKTDELVHAIQSDNVALIQSVKGIGAKSAQRVIIELRDKVIGSAHSSTNLNSPNNTLYNEALSALIMLGFAKNSIEKTLQNIMKDQTLSSAEEIVKLALRQL